MVYSLLDLSHKNKWNDLLKSFPVDKQDVYFTPEYYSLYEKLGDGKAQCFVFENGGNLAMYPYMINSVNNLDYNLDEQYYDIQGAYGYNGVISTSYNKDFIKSFYKAFIEYVNASNIIAEFVRFHPLLSNQNFSEKNLQIVNNRRTVFIDLQSTIEEVCKDFSNMCIRALKKTKKMKLEIQICSEIEKMHLNEFTQLYYHTMNRVNSCNYLFFNDSYFKNLVKLSNVVQFSCIFDNKIIASTFCFYSHEYFHYHLGASLTDYLFLKPNNLLFFEMIKYAKVVGCKYIHFGGGNSLSKDDSLLKFKSNFSKTLADFYIGRKIHNKKIYNEVVKQWSTKSPNKIKQYQNFLLKYRY